MINSYLNPLSSPAATLSPLLQKGESKRKAVITFPLIKRKARGPVRFPLHLVLSKGGKQGVSSHGAFNFAKGLAHYYNNIYLT